MEIKQNICPNNKYNIKCPYPMNPIGICIHNTANDASAANEISYMINNSSSTSFHFAVDDAEVIQGLPLDRNAWHAGDGGSGEGNRKYISIEICYSKSGGARFEAAMKKAALLTAQLLTQYRWTIDNVKKHQDFSGKYCPHRILSDYGWNYFLNLVKTNLNETPTPQTTNIPDGEAVYTVKVTADTLNVRDGAGANYPINTTISKNGVYTIVDRRGEWGLLKSLAGWINLKYTETTNTVKSEKYTSFDKALDALVQKGVINTADYWKANSTALPYLEKLIISMANTHLRSAEKNGYTNIEQALSAMTKIEVINSPDYWLSNCSKVHYLDTLIIRFANRLWV